MWELVLEYMLALKSRLSLTEKLQYQEQTRKLSKKI